MSSDIETLVARLQSGDLAALSGEKLSDLCSQAEELLDASQDNDKSCQLLTALSNPEVGPLLERRNRTSFEYIVTVSVNLAEHTRRLDFLCAALRLCRAVNTVRDARVLRLTRDRLSREDSEVEDLQRTIEGVCEFMQGTRDLSWFEFAAINRNKRRGVCQALLDPVLSALSRLVSEPRVRVSAMQFIYLLREDMETNSRSCLRSVLVALRSIPAESLEASVIHSLCALVPQAPSASVEAGAVMLLNEWWTVHRIRPIRFLQYPPQVSSPSSLSPKTERLSLISQLLTALRHMWVGNTNAVAAAAQGGLELAVALVTDCDPTLLDSGACSRYTLILYACCAESEMRLTHAPRITGLKGSVDALFALVVHEVEATGQEELHGFRCVLRTIFDDDTLLLEAQGQWEAEDY